MATERTKRERIWRACQIQRQWRIMDMVAALGIPASTTHGILQELVASGAVGRVGQNYRLIASGQRLPIRDPERETIRHRVLKCVSEAPMRLWAEAVASALSIEPAQALRALRDLSESGQICMGGHGLYAAIRAGKEARHE